MKIINTQHLKKGTITNFGVVAKVFDNAQFQTEDGFTWHVKNNDVYKLSKSDVGNCRSCGCDIYSDYEIREGYCNQCN